MLDVNTLTSDIQTVTRIVEALEGLLPGGDKLRVYTDFLSKVLQNPTLLQLLVAWVNTLTQQPAPNPPANQ